MRLPTMIVASLSAQRTVIRRDQAAAADRGEFRLPAAASKGFPTGLQARSLDRSHAVASSRNPAVHQRCKNGIETTLLYS